MPAEDAVKLVLENQCNSWNKGDLAAFMSAYLNSEQISFSSGGQVLHGYKALEERYRKRYGDNPESMGKLSFSGLELSELGKGRDTALVLGNWRLIRKEGDLNGVFSLVLVKDGHTWKIIHDHTSVAEKKSE